MNLLFALTYYRPHISGLTIYVQRIAEALATKRHTVTVITSQYDSALPRDEVINGVRIVRVPVSFHISKGVIMPGYTKQAKTLIRDSDLCFVNLPSTPIEAISIPTLAQQAGKPVFGIFHCDLHLPVGSMNRFANAVVSMTCRYACNKVDKIVTCTKDYSDASPILTRFKNKCELIPPPIYMAKPRTDAVEAFKHIHAPNGETLIGFAARFATEKGLEYLVRAIPEIRKHIQKPKVLFAGPCRNVVGEEKYQRRVMPMINELNGQWEFLGILGDVMETFYAACDVTVLPSVNCTESFGLVQVESMLCGTPVVASNIPGVRVPVMETGMGRLAGPGNPQELANAIVTVLQDRDRYIRPSEEIRSIFSLEKTVNLYDDMIKRAVTNSGEQLNA